jgi:carboxypeptidase A1
MRTWISLIVLVAAVVFVAGAAPVNDGSTALRLDNHRLVRAWPQSPEQIRRLHELSVLLLSDHEGFGGAPVDYIVPPEAMAALDAMDLRYEVIKEDVQKDIDAERARLAAAGPVDPRSRGWFDDFKSLDQIVDKLEAWAADYPDLAEVIDVGDTIEGRDIWGIRITGSGEDKPAVLFDATQHAREWIAPMVAMYAVDYMLTQYGVDPEITELVDDVEIYLIPVVNPDGYSYSWTNERYWRKNRRDNEGSPCYGVDPNRNWETGWGGGGSSGDPCSETYRGTAPFSEPCTQAMEAFYIAHPNLVASIDFHSHGEYILYPWAYQGGGCDDDGMHQEVGEVMQALIAGVHGHNYTLGSCYNTLYQASGSSVDWTWGDQGVLSYTIELRGPDFVIPPSEIIPNSEEILPAALYLTEWSSSPVKFTFPEGLPQMAQAGEETPVRVDITVWGGSPIEPGTEMLFARIGSDDPFTAYDLTDLGDGDYEGMLPAAPCGSQIQYYFQAETTDGMTFTSPDDAPDSYYAVDAWVIDVAFADDMESDQGWTVGDVDDDATTGIWERVDPEGTPAQPEDDHTAPPGVNCWVTDGDAGNSIGDYDIDDGKTTLFTPTLNLSDTGDPVISYWRWYSNDEGADPNNDIFVVDISPDGGNNWTNVETVGPAGAESSGGWFYHEFYVADFIEPTADVMMRFIASDENAGSIVEAAIDDFAIMEIGCPCDGDFDGDGDVDTADLLYLLAAWGTPDGDMDGDGDTDTADLLALLANWGECP